MRNYYEKLLTRVWAHKLLVQQSTTGKHLQHNPKLVLEPLASSLKCAANTYGYHLHRLYSISLK